MADRPSPLSPKEAKALIDLLLSYFDGLSFTEHSRTRAHERRFDTFDIRAVLERGLPEVDCWDEKHLNWKYKVVGKDVDGDPLTIVVVLDDENQVIKVITGHG